MKKLLAFLVPFTFVAGASAEMAPMDDDALDDVSGQSGITINARVEFGDETNFVYTNTSGKTSATATAAETSYFIVDGISGAIEMEGLDLDLVSDLNSSGRPALQWTLPEKITATRLRASGLYASDTETVTAGSSTFLLAVEVDGTLTLPAETQISVFVTN